MGTRSNIVVRRKDDWAEVYCHWDGYPSHNGKILLEHYSDQAKLESLIALGDLSVLDQEITAPKGHSYDTRAPGHSAFYGRDRGETDIEARTGATLEDVWPDEEYAYVWIDKTWWVARPSAGIEGLRLLADVLKDEDLLEKPGKGPDLKGLRPATPAEAYANTSTWGQF